MSALVSNILTQVFITLIAVAGVYVLTGLTGMFSLGQAAFMAIGAKYGNVEPGDMARKGLCLQKRQEFIDSFVKEFGSLTCPGLLGLDLRLEEDMAKAQERKVLTDICPKYCVRAIEITKDIL